MKKKIAIILCIILMVSVLAGCSDAELGYLKMSSDVADMKEYSMTGTATLTFNQESLMAAFEDFEQTISQIAMPEEKQITTKPAVDFKSIGAFETVVVNYTLKQILKEGQLTFELAANANIRNKQVDLGKMYVDAKKGIYVSKETLLGVYEIAGIFDPMRNESYAYTPEFKAKLLKCLEGGDYITLLDAESMKDEDYGLQGMDISASMLAETVQIKDMAMKFLTEGFKGFETGWVTNIPAGYAVELDVDKLMAFAKNMLTYMSQNVGTVLDAFNEYISEIEKMTEDATPASEASEPFESLKLTAEDQLLVNVICAQASALLDRPEVKAATDLFRGSNYMAQITKVGATVSSKTDFALLYKGVTMIKLDSKSSIATLRGDISLPAEGLALDVAGENITRLFNEENPVKDIKISWYKDKHSQESVAATYERAHREPYLSPNQQFAYLNARFINNELYVPVRPVTESLGFTVEWDNSKKQAYVMQDGQKTYLQGMIEYTTSYVKLRELEKLGVKVNYSAEDGMHMVDLIPGV